MKLEGSLQCSEWPDTVPYPEPDESNHTLAPYLPKIRLILSSHLHLGLPRGLLSWRFPTKFMNVFFLTPNLLHVPLHHIVPLVIFHTLMFLQVS